MGPRLLWPALLHHHPSVLLSKRPSRPAGRLEVIRGSDKDMAKHDSSPLVRDAHTHDSGRQMSTSCQSIGPKGPSIRDTLSGFCMRPDRSLTDLQKVRCSPNRCMSSQPQHRCRWRFAGAYDGRRNVMRVLRPRQISKRRSSEQRKGTSHVAGADGDSIRGCSIMYQ